MAGSRDWLRLSPFGPEELDLAGNVYRRIVENELASEEEFQSLRTLAHTLLAREHVDSIILAGTDLSLVFHPGNTDFPHIDGARTHIGAIMREVPKGSFTSS